MEEKEEEEVDQEKFLTECSKCEAQSTDALVGSNCVQQHHAEDFKGGMCTVCGTQDNRGFNHTCIGKMKAVINMGSLVPVHRQIRETSSVSKKATFDVKCDECGHMVDSTKENLISLRCQEIHEHEIKKRYSGDEFSRYLAGYKFACDVCSYYFEFPGEDAYLHEKDMTHRCSGTYKKIIRV